MAQNDSTRDVIPGFGEAVRARRLELGYSQAELGERAGVHPMSIHKLEAGKRAPSLRIARDIADALEITLDRLIRDADRRTDGSSGG